jgi:SAM-dependent methyltransferase
MAKTAPFEDHADAYEHWFDEHPAIYAAELEAVRRLLPPPGFDGLEVGVGSGRFAAPLGIGNGVEPSPRMAARARARGIRVAFGVAEALPFAAKRFDVVLLVTTICFVDDAAGALGEAYRVLKPGGSVLVGFVDRDSDLGAAYERRRDTSRFYRDAVFFSTAEVVALIEGAGFTVDAVRQTLVPGEAPDAVLAGSGRGAFVVIRGRRVGAAGR